MTDAFDSFDAQVGTLAKRATALAAQAARQAKVLHNAAQVADLRTLRQRAADAAARAAEAAAAAEELRQAIDAFELLPAAAEVAAAAETPAPAAASAGSREGVESAYAAAFEGACAAAEVRLEQSYPEYRVFPFDVRIRLSEERALVGRRSLATLRPEALARSVRRERDRLFGGSFAAERFGSALVRAFEVLLPEAREKKGEQTRQVGLRDVLRLLQIGTFGRNSYSGDEFAFDLYRFRQGAMTVGNRQVMLLDARGWGTGFKVPNGRGSHDELNALHVYENNPEATAVGR